MSNNCARADLDAAHDHGPAPDRCRATHRGFFHRPVFFRLRRPVAVGRAWITIVDEDHAMADEDFVLDSHAAANEAVARDLAAPADSGAALTSTKAPSRVSAPISQPYKLTNGLSWTPGPSRTSSATHAYRPDSSRCIAAPLFHRAVDRDRTSLLAEGQARSFEHAHYL